MTTLLVDIGNTRIKWARLRDRQGVAQFGRCRAAAHAGWKVADYDRRVIGSARGVTQVCVASVAGEAVDRAVSAAARRHGIRAHFVSVPRRAAGVRVGYLEPWRLGVDRFVAAVGAHYLFPGMPVWVVGVGTAMTLDLIAADGTHQGGAIVPAPALMVDTLLTRTSGIRRRAQGGSSSGKGLLARSTRAAIRQGARFAAAALIDRAVLEGEELLGRRPFVVITGGGSTAVRSLLKSPAAGVPDLVLRGLAVLAQEAPQSRARRR